MSLYAILKKLGSRITGVSTPFGGLTWKAASDNETDVIGKDDVDTTQDIHTIINLEGTRWESNDSQGRCFQFEFRAHGLLRYTQFNEEFDTGSTYENGNWRQVKDIVFFETGKGFARYEGCFSGSLLSGDAKNLKGHRWSWTARKIG